MQCLLSLASRILSGAATILLFAALFAGVSQGALGSDCDPIEDCQNVVCASCTEASNKDCNNPAGVKNGSCASTGNCTNCNCGRSSRKNCDCKEM